MTATQGPQGHRSVDHTADLALEVWAPSEAALLQEAALALSTLLMDGPPPAATRSTTVALQAFDAQDRLVRWLAEVLYLAMTDRFVTERAEVVLTPQGLTATLHGSTADVACEIKAVTYHDLRLTHVAPRWLARIVFDV